MIRFQIGNSPVQLTPELLKRYAVPGPRYTSYPPVPAWGGEFSAHDHARALKQMDASERSVYVHIPFCRKRCLYCGCNVVISSSEARADAYVDTLEREIEQVAGHVRRDRPVVQFHWGGGTPTFLTPAQIRRLWTALTNHFPLAANAEAGVEIDPRTTTHEHLDTLRELGANRLSIGVQDFDPTVQQSIRRENSPEMVADLVKHAREIGFRSINFDLIYGLPYQTGQTLARTLDQVIELRPDRIALFAYAHLPERFRHQRALPEAAMPAGLDRMAMFGVAVERLTDGGWEFIGLDHFALPHDDLAVARNSGTLHRNFMGYTTHAGTDMLAFGASAISDLSGAYAQNARGVDEWAAAVDAGELPTIGGVWTSQEDQVRRDVIMRLLCNGRLERTPIEIAWRNWFGAREFDTAFADSLDRLQPLIADGLLTDDYETIELTPLGRIFVRNVAMCFDTHLPGDRSRARSQMQTTV